MAFKFEDVNLTGWILVGVLIVCAAALFVIARNRQKWTTRMLANAAICMALSFLLSYIRLFKLPQGGSVTAASLLPIIAFAYSYGHGAGACGGHCLRLFADDSGSLDCKPNPGGFGLSAGIRLHCAGGRGSQAADAYGWLVGVLLAGVGRFVCHVLSGVVFFAEYAEGSGLSPFAYSLSYNSFVFVDLAICAVVIAFPQVRKALKRMTEENR